jgi:hypothetical protein
MHTRTGGATKITSWNEDISLVSNLFDNEKKI